MDESQAKVEKEVVPKFVGRHITITQDSDDESMFIARHNKSHEEALIDLSLISDTEYKIKIESDWYNCDSEAHGAFKKCDVLVRFEFISNRKYRLVLFSNVMKRPRCSILKRIFSSSARKQYAKDKAIYEDYPKIHHNELMRAESEAYDIEEYIIDRWNVLFPPEEKESVNAELVDDVPKQLTHTGQGSLNE